MTAQQEIERNVKFLNEAHTFCQKRITDQAMAHGAVCSLTLLATQIAHRLNDGDPVGTRNLMVGALNLALKHGVTTTNP